MSQSETQMWADTLWVTPHPTGPQFTLLPTQIPLLSWPTNQPTKS